MQQPSPIPYFYSGIQYNTQDGGGVTPHQWGQALQDGAKPQQYQPAQWDNNGAGYQLSGSTFGPGPGGNAGGQNRVPVPPQQQHPQQPSQPTPTSTPPAIHGDINKQQALMQNQQPQINFVQRQINQTYQQFPRGGMQQTQIRNMARPPGALIYNQLPGAVLTQAPTQTILQAPGGFSVMYPTPPRQTPAPFNQAQQLYMQQSYQHAAAYQQPFFVQQQYQQPMPSGGPSPQPGTPQPTVQPMQRPIMVPQPPQPLPQPKNEHKKRPNAIKIIDPSTNEEVALGSENEAGGNNNNVTPTRSNDSSARETPQPKAGVTGDNTVAAEFAARVAAAIAPESSSPSPSPTQPQPPDTPTLSDSETHHKQPSVPSSERIISNTVLSSNSMEFVPRFKQAQPCEPPPLEDRTPVVPTVSAETNAPAIEIQRKPEPVKSTVPATGQSPSKTNAKKQKGGENERQAVIAPLSVQPQPHVEKDNAAFAKKGPKSIQKEEIVTLPKERREKTRSVSKEQSPVVSPAITPDITSSQPEFQPAKAPLAAPVPTSQLPPPVLPVPVPVPPPVEEPLLTKVPPHHNGETALPDANPIHDGNKSTKHKNKKNVKMRELNRKGVDREGSDMDAFTTETIVNEDRPATPASPPLVPAPALTIEPTAPLSPVDKIKEDLEEKEDKLVAAKNEENAKVSALPPKEEEEPEPVSVIENEEKKEKPQPPQLTLRLSYTKDQWSPLNQAGKKKYDRDFLLELKSERQSMVKPEGLPDVVASLMRNDIPFIPSRNSKMIMPEFARSSTSQRGVPPKRGSQQGMKRGDDRSGKGGGVRVMHMSLSSDHDVKLKTTENAWKPNRLDSTVDKSEEEKQTEELYKNVRGILNKLTPQKFDTLIKKFVALPISSESRLQGVIKLIFEKAVDEPSFSTAYANMCKVCSKLEVSKEMEAANAEKKEEKVSLRKLLINRCQQEFESNSKAELNIAKWLEDINNCTDPEKKKELQANFEGSERKIRMKSVGNIRFIGELFKLGMLTPAIMYRCIEQLLSCTDEESLECLCKLLTTIGKDLENQKSANPGLNPHFAKMADLAQKKDNSKVSSRVRFMLRDVIDLRNSKWIPRREDSKPKTIEQINKEAEKESMEASMALNQPAPRMRQGDRHDDRKGGRGPRGNNQSDDGWNTVGRGNYNRMSAQPAFDASKMQTMTKPDQDLTSVSLGGSSMFSGFGSMGAKAKQQQPQFTSANAFSVLNSQDKKTSNMRRVTPSTSMERDRERQRMIQGVSEGEGRNSRGSSMQRERLQPLSQPPSRDSSQPRQPVEDNREASHPKLDDKPAGHPEEQMTDEKLERHTVTIFEEYLQDLSSIEDIKLDLEQYYTGGRIEQFVEKALSISLDKKPPAQNKIGGLLAALLDYNVIPVSVFVNQLAFIYEAMDDIAIDVPKVWELQALVVVPIIAAEKVNFGHFKEACKPIQRTNAVPKLLVPVLQFLSKAKGEGFARKMWDLSNVSIKDFMAEEGADVNAFIKEHSLDFLVGEAPKCDQPSMDQVHEKMLKLMKMNQPYEKIVEFISSNVGDKIDDLHFIRALIIAICESCITGANYSFDQAKFKQYEKLITRFVDTKEDRELAALNSVHILLSRLQHPQGLINSIFSVFLDDNLISSESFLKWKNDGEVIENKGVSILSLTSFFTALEEVETDDETS